MHVGHASCVANVTGYMRDSGSCGHVQGAGGGSEVASSNTSWHVLRVKTFLTRAGPGRGEGGLSSTDVRSSLHFGLEVHQRSFEHPRHDTNQARGGRIPPEH